MGGEDGIKKKYRPGRIEDDPNDPYTLVVHYDIEEYSKGDGTNQLACLPSTAACTIYFLNCENEVTYLLFITHVCCRSYFRAHHHILFNTSLNPNSPPLLYPALPLLLLYPALPICLPDWKGRRQFARLSAYVYLSHCPNLPLPAVAISLCSLTPHETGGPPLYPGHLCSHSFVAPPCIDLVGVMHRALAVSLQHRD